jgi:hypothetical protein
LHGHAPATVFVGLDDPVGQDRDRLVHQLETTSRSTVPVLTEVPWKAANFQLCGKLAGFGQNLS